MSDEQIKITIIDSTSLKSKEITTSKGVYEVCSQQDLKKLMEVVGSETIDFVEQRNDAIKLYKLTKEFSVIQSQNDNYVLQTADRAVFIVVVRDIKDRSFKNLEINFIFWKDFLKGNYNYQNNGNSLENDTLSFLRTMQAFLKTIQPHCDVEFSGSDSQRDKIWKAGIAKLNREGHTNIRMKETIVLNFEDFN